MARQGNPRTTSEAVPMGLRQRFAQQAEKSRQRFLAFLDQPRQTQQQLLTRCLETNAGCEFGQLHGFDSIRDFDEYRSRVPLRDYAELEPWIERMTAGESAVLTGRDPIRFWKTTGTTNHAKKIPVTPDSAALVNEAFLALQGSWFQHYPQLAERADSTLALHLSPRPVHQFLGPRRLAYCTTTEVPVEVRPGREQHLPPWLIPLQEQPLDDHQRLLFLISFSARHDLLAIACLHPSRFQTLSRTLHEFTPLLIQDIRHGTLLGQPHGPSDPQRALNLERTYQQKGRLIPSDVWPHLLCLSSWSGSYLERYRSSLNEYCSGFFPTPSISSEIFLTLSIDPNPISQPLNLRGGIFEFLPTHQEVGAHAPTLTFWELQDGQEYEVIYTNLGGLYRYVSCDIFRVAGFHGEVPRLEYVGRRSVTDLTGEKLAEEHVRLAMSRAVQELGLEFAPACLCPQPDDPRYVLVWESSADCREVADAVECHLRDLNSRYDLKRRFQDLHPVELRRVAPGTLESYRQYQIGRGSPAGQLKERWLESTALLQWLSQTRASSPEPESHRGNT